MKQRRTNMNIFEELTEKLNEINEIDYVNCGGCAIVAYGLQKYIKDNHPNMNPQIMYLFNRYDNECYENVKNNRNDSSCHVVVKVGDTYIDSEGVHVPSELKHTWSIINELQVPREFALLSINEAIWNPAFDRKEGIPKIKEILGLDDEFVNSISTKVRTW